MPGVWKNFRYKVRGWFLAADDDEDDGVVHGTIFAHERKVTELKKLCRSYSCPVLMRSIRNGGVGHLLT